MAGQQPPSLPFVKRQHTTVPNSLRPAAPFPGLWPSLPRHWNTPSGDRVLVCPPSVRERRCVRAAIDTPFVFTIVAVRPVFHVCCPSLRARADDTARVLVFAAKTRGHWPRDGTSRTHPPGCSPAPARQACPSLRRPSSSAAGTRNAPCLAIGHTCAAPPHLACTTPLQRNKFCLGVVRTTLDTQLRSWRPLRHPVSLRPQGPRIYR